MADNLDLGRPDSVELLFTGKRPGGRGRPVNLDIACTTKVVTRDTEVTINVFFKHSRVSSTSKTAARCGSRPSSTHRATCAASAACATSTRGSQSGAAPEAGAPAPGGPVKAEPGGGQRRGRAAALI